MNFESDTARAREIFAQFPNRNVWKQGGPGPNRQIDNPEAGYCIVLRYDEETSAAIAGFMDSVRAVLPPVVSYSPSTYHTTLGVFGKGPQDGFVSNAGVSDALAAAVEEGLAGRSARLEISLEKWLYNREALLVSALPNKALWQLRGSIAAACRNHGFPLNVSRILHVTTARFIHEVSRETFVRFAGLVDAAPVFGPVAPPAVDVASWRCDGLSFQLEVHRRFSLHRNQGGKPQAPCSGDSSLRSE